MRALHAHAGVTQPVLDAVEPPALGPADVRIRVAYAAVNPVDLAVLTGPLRQLVELPDPVGLGWDVSGTVTEVGADVTEPSPGDLVAGMLPILGLTPSVGTHADETVLPASSVARIPDGLAAEAAATVPLNGLAACLALDLIGPGDGRRLLITGAAGAVGGYAVTLAARAGWRVTALARASDDAFVRRAGAADLVTAVPAERYEAVIDAAVLLDSALGAVADGGTFVCLAPGREPEPRRDIAVTTVDSATGPDRARLADLMRLAADGVLETRVAGTLPLTEATTAYERVAGGSHRGRWLVAPLHS